jgi:dienelactone hydrolase
VCRFLKQGKLDAGFTAHPSFVDAEEVQGIQGPLSIAAAGTSNLVLAMMLSQRHTTNELCALQIETDSIFPAPKRHETEEILLKLPVAYQINLFSDVEHGFAVRCDLSKRRQKFAKEQAFLQAVAWFDEHIKSA